MHRTHCNSTILKIVQLFNLGSNVSRRVSAGIRGTTESSPTQTYPGEQFTAKPSPHRAKSRKHKGKDMYSNRKFNI